MLNLMSGQGLAPTWTDLERMFYLKYGDPDATGWGPRMRFRHGYFTPEDFYEATVAKLVEEGCTWIDVGCGRDIFPDNRHLARVLAHRSGTLIGVDPDDRLDENPFVHQRVKCTIDDFHTDLTCDLVTLRMVAEHISDPRAAIASLARITRPGGKVVVYTVNRWAPVSILARIIPFGLHHPIKRLLWNTEERDTFPVVYRMNTRKRLARLFEVGGFTELYVDRLDDCRTSGRFRILHSLELMFRRLFRALGLRYPENCILGVYERVNDHQAVSPDNRRGCESSD
jgi:SAM-dependent methyltransferase